MNYLVQSQIVGDHHLISRAAACAATLGVSGPLQWAARHSWELVASPGWVDAYIASGKLPEGDPAAASFTAGADPAIITDEMILAAVQSLLASNPA